MASEWNSLEIAKLLASALTPIAVAIVGIYIHRLTKKYEHFQWRNQIVIEKRLQIYDELAPQLNDNLCYFTYIGSWKERSPLSVVESKRTIDRAIYLAAPLFSQFFFDACMKFQDLCFETYTGMGKDAQIKSRYESRKTTYSGQWEASWEQRFSKTCTDPK